MPMDLMTKRSNVTLSELKEGAVEEQFQRALGQVLDNIEDPNTDPKLKRVITIKVAFTPTPDRGMVMVDAQVTTKTSPARPVPTVLLLKTEKGPLVGEEPIQEQIPYQADITAN
jgi:hypothetical protein